MRRFLRYFPVSLAALPYHPVPIKLQTISVCGLYIVGSSLNGFGTNRSDMDLCLMVTNRDVSATSATFDLLFQGQCFAD